MRALARALTPPARTAFQRSDGGFELFLQCPSGRAVLHLSADAAGEVLKRDYLANLASLLELEADAVIEVYGVHYLYGASDPEDFFTRAREHDALAAKPNESSKCWRPGADPLSFHDRTRVLGWHDVGTFVGPVSLPEHASLVLLGIVAMNALAADLRIVDPAVEWSVRNPRSGLPHVEVMLDSVWHRLTLIGGETDLSGIACALAAELQSLDFLHNWPACPLPRHSHAMRCEASRVPAWLCPGDARVIGSLGRLAIGEALGPA